MPGHDGVMTVTRLLLGRRSADIHPCRCIACGKPGRSAGRHTFAARTSAGSWQVDMTQDKNGRPRLDVIEALLSLDQAASTVTGAWTALDGQQFSASDAALIDWATDEEWDIAGAVRGARGELSELDAEAVAGLLRIADGTTRATLL